LTLVVVSKKSTKHERFRSWVHKQHPAIRHAYRVLVAIAGSVVIITGLIMVPLPGPGWLVVFFGIALLGFEFPLFHRLSVWVRAKASTLWAKVRKHLPRKC
jgi:uncharacterized protein (TIGR02611 family)